MKESKEKEIVKKKKKKKVKQIPDSRPTNYLFGQN